MILLHNHTAQAIYKLGKSYCCEAFKIDIPRQHPDPIGRAITEIKIQLSIKPQGREFDRITNLFKVLPNGELKQIWPKP